MVSWGCTAITHTHFGKVRGKALQILGDYPKKSSDYCRKNNKRRGESEQRLGQDRRRNGLKKGQRKTEEDKSKQSKSGKREMVDLALIQVHLLDSNTPQSFQQKSTTL